MRLISCYIENFGKLSKQKIDFDPKLHVLKEDNGWGKTTLAAFIKSMFYGLPPANKKDIKENDRFRYSPWQGGKFGGYVIFEYDSKRFRIERFFGYNSSTEDTFRLIDEVTKRVTNVKEDNFGERIFGIDAEGYERSTFIPQNAITLDKLSGGLNAKLMALINDEKEGEGYEQAIDRLMETQTSLRKRRPHKGKLDIIDDEINTLKKEIEDCEDFENQAQRLQKEIFEAKIEYKKLEQTIAQLNDKIEALNEKEKRVLGKRMLDDLTKTIESESARIGQLNKFFNGQDINSLNLDDIKAKVKEAKDKQAQLNEINNKILTLKTQLAEKERDKSILINNQQIAVSKSSKALKISLFSGGALSVVAGIVALFFNVIAGAVLTGIGALALIGGAVVYLKSYIDSKLSAAAPVSSKDNEELLGIDKTIDNIRGQISFLETSLEGLAGEVECLSQTINNYLSKFSISKNDNWDISILEIENNISIYNESLKKKAEADEKLNSFAKENDISIFQNVIDEDINSDELKNQKFKYEQKKDDIIALIEKLKHEFAQAEERANNKEALKNELENLYLRREQLNTALEALKLTKQYLTDAKDIIASKYLEPISKSCKEYLSQFFGQDIIFNFDADTKPLIEEGGQNHAIDFYSCGIKEMMSLCARVALVDTLFQKEKAYIIMDDPFANLDDAKLELAKKFLKELSNKYQIIYFTCQSSREINIA